MPCLARRALLPALFAWSLLGSPAYASMDTETLTVVEAGSGRLLGSATAIGGERVLTNRHVIEAAQRRGAGLAIRAGARMVAVRHVGVSERLDVALLLAAEPVPGGAPPGRPPAIGQALRTRSPAGGWVGGEATRFAWRESWGPALFARLPVGFGFSGAPVHDATGAVIGLVTAAVNPTAREMTALRAEAGRSGGETPLVLVLPISAVLAEAERLLALADPRFGTGMTGR